MRFRLSSLAGLAGSVVLAAALAACSNLTGSDVPANRYAALNIQAKSTSTTAASGLATLIFFKGVNVTVPNSANQQTDQCIISGVDTSTVVTTGMNNAGNGIAFSVSGRSTALTYNTTLSRYEAAAGQVTYNSGETATLTIPDAGTVFPATTLSLKLAEPLIPNAITLPTAGNDWLVRWNGTNDDVSSIQVQLFYANSSTATKPNEQVYCVFKDDGTQAIPSQYLATFLASPNGLRSMRLMRWRTNERVVDANTLLHLASTIDTVITF